MGQWLGVPWLSAIGVQRPARPKAAHRARLVLDGDPAIASHITIVLLLRADYHLFLFQAGWG